MARRGAIDGGRRNKKREIRKAFKAVAGADLRREMETLSKTVVGQARIIKEMRDLLLRAWGADDVARLVPRGGDKQQISLIR